MEKNCATCAAYNAPANECRRHAPVMVPVPQPAIMPGKVNIASAGLYPATPATGWCCEWLAKPVELPAS